MEEAKQERKIERHIKRTKQTKQPYLSQARTVHAAIIHNEILKTNSTVPGHIVIKVFITKRVLKFILFNAPMLLDDASVKSLLCKSITLAIRYSLKNIGIDKIISTSAVVVDGA